MKFRLESEGKDIFLVIEMKLRPHQLQELKVAIEKWQGEQPFRTAKEATGGKQ